MAEYSNDRSQSHRSQDHRRGEYKDRRRSHGEDRRGGERYGNRGNRRGYGDRNGRGRYDDRDDRRGYGDRDDRRGNGRYDDSRDGNRRYGGHGKAQRGGAGRSKHFNGPNRAGFREERIQSRMNEPDLPNDIDITDLDPLVLQDLRVLSKENADAVAKHMIMAATWLADDPKLALTYARAAKERAGRVAVVRETAGIVAYHAGEWKEALSELRAARRMSGGPGLIAVMADCERGLGKPQKAIEMAKEIDPATLDRETRIELAIVVAGARQDLQQLDAALATLQRESPDPDKIDYSYARLSYAYADTLAAAGRTEEARQWFEHAVKQDVDEATDAKQRLEELQ